MFSGRYPCNCFKHILGEYSRSHPKQKEGKRLGKKKNSQHQAPEGGHMWLCGNHGHPFLDNDLHDTIKTNQTNSIIVTSHELVIKQTKHALIQISCYLYWSGSAYGNSELDYYSIFQVLWILLAAYQPIKSTSLQ